MNLYFLRHGIAEAHSSSDAERELTAEGIEIMRAETIGIKKLGLEFDLILSSPYKRAKQTAEIVASEYGNQKIEESLHLTPSASWRDLFSEIETKYSSYKEILLATHEPFVSNVINLFLPKKGAPVLGVPKGGLCKIEAGSLDPQPTGKLDFLLKPEQLIN